MELAIVVSLLVIQQAFYMFHQHKLINKLMSRNYFEYSQGQKLEKKEKIKIPNADPWELENLNEIPRLEL